MINIYGHFKILKKYIKYNGKFYNYSYLLKGNK